MSIKIMAEVFQSSLGANEKLVLLVYADHAGAFGENVYPSYGRAAHMTSLHKTTVIKVTNKLRALGILQYVGESKWGTNEFVIRAEAIPIQAAFEMKKRGRPKKKASEYLEDKGSQALPFSRNKDSAEKNKGSAQKNNGSAALPDPKILTRKQEEEKRRGKPKHLSVEDLSFPFELDAMEFINVFQQFLEARIEMKKPATARAAQMLLKKLVPFGRDHSIELLERAIANGWQGVIFERDEPREFLQGKSRAEIAQSRSSTGPHGGAI